MGTQLPLEKGTAPHHIFGPCLLWPNSSMDQDACWYGVNLRPGDVVLDGVAAPPKRSTAPSFRSVYFGQTAGWMMTPLGTEVDLGTGRIVLDGDPAPPEKAQQPHSLFSPCLLWPRSPISATAELLHKRSLENRNTFLAYVFHFTRMTITANKQWRACKSFTVDGAKHSIKHQWKVHVFKHFTCGNCD